MSQTTVQETSRPFEVFQDLMPFRVQDILLVSSLYDSFTLQEEGRLNELLLGEFLKLSLQQIPGLIHVSSGAAALARAEAERRFNLILTTINLGDPARIAYGLSSTATMCETPSLNGN